MKKFNGDFRMNWVRVVIQALDEVCLSSKIMDKIDERLRVIGFHKENPKIIVVTVLGKVVDEKEKEIETSISCFASNSEDGEEYLAAPRLVSGQKTSVFHLIDRLQKVLDERTAVIDLIQRGEHKPFCFISSYGGIMESSKWG